MFRGERIDANEDRTVLHIALRLPTPVESGVTEVLERMSTFAEQVRTGHSRGCIGERITAVVNIGIGGSDLGPAMAYHALREQSPSTLIVRFVSDVDGHDVDRLRRDLDPARTLFVVASKTFSTVETLANAHTARAWLCMALGDAADVRRHLVAVSTNAAEVETFGIDRAHMLEFWDWVGGRYSLSSAIGLSVMVAIGPRPFRQLLAGMRSMDEHVRVAPLRRNVPVLLGLVGVWCRNFWGVQTQTVLPYDRRLSRFPAYLQQMEMQSNGKSITRTVSMRSSSCCTRAPPLCRATSSVSSARRPGCPSTTTC
jgi:glucose-6-phosphate isomerase